MPLSIIRASTEHIETLVPLFDAYRQFYEQPSDPSGAKVYLTERLARDEAVVFLALLDDQPVGFTLLYPTFSSVRMRFFWVLNDLFVAPEGRKHGGGGALLERAREHGIETGAALLELNTAITNLTAQSVYEAHGWQRDTKFYKYTLPL